MLFWSPHFGVISILIPIFIFYHFQSLIQLTLVILVLSVSQQTEMANVANGLIKILIKIHCGSCSPMPPRFLAPLLARDPYYPPNQYQKSKIPQISPASPKPNQSTFVSDLRQPSNHHSKQTNHHCRQTNPEIYIPKPIFLGIAEKRKAKKHAIAVRSLYL